MGVTAKAFEGRDLLDRFRFLLSKIVYTNLKKLLTNYCFITIIEVSNRFEIISAKKNGGILVKEEMQVTNQRYRLGYHLMPKSGWINDPNGFSYFKGYYHMFYQYYPYAAEWGPMHWGHARSKDMIHWETLPTALVPGDMESGCFSGSAIEHNGKLWLIYTGHHYFEPNDNESFYENQNLAYSEDGVHFTKYEGNPVLRVPADNTKHFRDPKVWKEGDTFYMVLGSQGEDELGRALLFASKDLINWERVSIMSKAKNLKEEGYMWECPDFFHLDGQDVLLMSPQGLEADGDRFRNLNQTGYIMGQLGKDKVLSRGEFVEIDNGHDFYATQTMLTPDGRRVMVAWMNAWDSDMHEKQDGWAGALTIPRELHIKDDHIYQQPVNEMEALRTAKLIAGVMETGHEYELPRTAELNLAFEAADGELFNITDGEHNLTIGADTEGGRLVIQRNTKDGERAAQVADFANLKLQIFVDKTSAEIFVNEGERTFTERIYWDAPLTIEMGSSCQAVVYKLEEETNKY